MWLSVWHKKQMTLLKLLNLIVTELTRKWQKHFLPGRKEEHFPTPLTPYVFYLLFLASLHYKKNMTVDSRGNTDDGVCPRALRHTNQTPVQLRPTKQAIHLDHWAWLQSSKQKAYSYSNTILIHSPDGASPSHYINSTTLNHKWNAESNRWLGK